MANSGPILTGVPVSLNATENATALLAPTATLVDLDGTFAGGTLVVSGLLADDVVSIRNQGTGLRQVGFSGGLVTFEGNPIGVATGGVGGTLLVVFTPGVNPVGVMAVLANLTYTSTSDTPIVDHTLELKIVDTAGAAAVAPIALSEQTGAANPFDSFRIGDRPVFADVNGDGRVDVVVGDQSGHIHYLQNTGTAAAPVFTEQTGANDPFAATTTPGRSTPALADLDGDGRLDLLVGATDGGLRYFRNTGTATAPVFTAVPVGANPFAAIRVANNSAPAFADIDGDGDQDLLVGTAGAMRYFQNTGSAVAPSFTERVGVANPFSTVSVASNTAPTFVDVGRDGDLDLVVGTDGGLRFYENTGTAIAPTYVQRVGLQDAFSNIHVSVAATPGFADIDGDGRIDIVVGDVTTNQLHFVANTSADEAATDFLQLNGGVNPFNAGHTEPAAHPTFVDLDHDGDLDLIKGTADGTLVYFTNAGTAVAPTFARGLGGNPLAGVSVGSNSAPSFADLDRDGDLDAIVGGGDGQLHYYENTGIATSPVFTERTGTANPFDGVTVPGRSAPVFVDLDRDGDQDLVLGASDGILRYYENTSAPGALQFTLRGGAADPFDGINVGTDSAPAFVDADRDGDLDLVIANQAGGTLRYYENTGTAVAPLFTARTGAANPFAAFIIAPDGKPSFADFDGDGDADLVVGTIPGAIQYFRNTGPGFDMAIHVTAVNDAPSGTNATKTILEDSSYAFALADFGFADAEGNALAAVKIATLPTAGMLTNNGAAVIAGDVIDVGDILAGHLTFTPAPNGNGANYAQFTFQVRDDGGTANGGLNTDATPNTFAFDVTPVNDAPVGANAAVTTVEDTPYVFTEADFGFTDPLDNNAFRAVKIVGLPAAGSLTNNNAAVHVGDSIALADIQAGLLRFAPSLNGHGSPYASLTFQVQDDGGTANGGIDLDPTPRTITIAVTDVNDPPAVGPGVGGASNTIAYAEQAAAVFLDDSIVVTDPDSPTLAGATLTITSGYQIGDVLHFTNQPGITGTYANGVLTLTGLATLAAYQTALQSITFDNVSNDDPTDGGASPARTITWQTDDGQVTNNLSNISTTTINVAAVNDAPVNHVPAPQHTQPETALAIAGLAVSDVDAASGIIATTLAVGHGTLTVAALGGAAVTGNGSATLSLTGTVAQINAALAGHVIYRSADGYHGNDSLTVHTDDGGHTGAGALTDTDTVAITLGHALPLLPQGDGHYDSDHSGASLLRHDDGTLRIEDVNGGQLTAHILGALGNEWHFIGTGDFNGNGTSDLLSVRSSDGMLLIHSVANNQVTGASFLGALGTDWAFRATGDFNHDGTADLLWQQDSTGMLLIHDVQNNRVSGSAVLGAIGTDWTFLGTGDFNHDGADDLLWRQDGTGMLVVHDIQNNRVAGSAFLGAIGSDWHFAGTGDFNGDHTADLLFQADDGTLRIYDIVNNHVVGSHVVETLANDTYVAGLTDYNGDGTDDLLLRHDDGRFELHGIGNNVVIQVVSLGQVDPAWHII